MLVVFDVRDIWHYDSFLLEFAHTSTHVSMAPVLRLVQSSRAVCNSELMAALVRHVLGVVQGQRQCKVLSHVVSVLFSLRRINPRMSVLYSRALEGFHNEMPCMYNSHEYMELHNTVRLHTSRTYHSARVFELVHRELMSTNSSQATRTICVSIIQKSIMNTRNHMVTLLDFDEQSNADKESLCSLLCTSLLRPLPDAAPNLAANLGLVWTLEALSCNFFCGIVIDNMLCLFGQAVSTQDNLCLEVFYGAIVRILLHTHEPYAARRYLRENDILSQILLMYHENAARAEQCVHVAFSSLVQAIIRAQDTAHQNDVDKIVQVLTPLRSRRSRAAIWFREGSQKEGDRIVACYRFERELGLSSGCTENYSCTSPWVEPSFGLPFRTQITRLDLRERSCDRPGDPRALALTDALLCSF